ncbi:MAG: DUF2520 domain-containing protein [Chloroflexi bacterium]|nr:DUF2520 domain-containing protein [Chloroflexota bacterium]
MAELPSVGFIGAGRVASTLAPALAAAGYRVAAVASRTSASAERVAALVPGAASPDVQSAQGVADAAELVFLTTSDGAIGPVAGALRWRDGQAVVHCSGALTLDPLAAARKYGALVGSWHPFQTFVAPGGAEGTSATLAGVTFGIEADAGLYERLAELARRVGGVALPVPAGARVLYHAASVMSCGYLTTLLHEAEALWKRAGLPPEAAGAAIGVLAETTLANLRRAGAEAALSGPTSRGDEATVRLHLDAVAARAPELLPLYAAVSARSAVLAEEAGRPVGETDWAALFAEYATHSGGEG